MVYNITHKSFRFYCSSGSWQLTLTPHTPKAKSKNVVCHLLLANIQHLSKIVNISSYFLTCQKSHSNGYSNCDSVVAVFTICFLCFNDHVAIKRVQINLKLIVTQVPERFPYNTNEALLLLSFNGYLIVHFNSKIVSFKNLKQ